MNLVLIKRRTIGREHTVFIKSVQSAYISLTDMNKKPRNVIYLMIFLISDQELLLTTQFLAVFTLKLSSDSPQENKLVLSSILKKKSNLKFHKLEDSFHLLDFLKFSQINVNLLKKICHIIETIQHKSFNSVLVYKHCSSHQ